MSVKVHRVVLKIVDHEGTSQENIKVELEQIDYFSVSVVKIESRVLCKNEDWEDDNRFNYHQSLAQFNEAFDAL